MDPNNIDTICISGGGIKGFCFIGALNYLISKNYIYIKNINNWCGTSIGAVICFLLSIGYTINEIENFNCGNVLSEFDGIFSKVAIK